jgi:hypothetical protein
LTRIAVVSPLAQAIAFQNASQPAQTGIAPTDVVGAYKLASDVAEKNYQAKMAAQMGMWGGLASLGSAGIRGFAPAGGYGSALSKLFGSGTPAGASSGVASTPAAFAPTDAELSGGITGTGANAPAFGSVAADLGSTAPAAGTVAGDLAGTAGTGAGLGELADLAPAAGGSVAGDLAALAPAAGATDLAAASMPEWLAAFLPFLA